jgi:hypothetical protein
MSRCFHVKTQILLLIFELHETSLRRSFDGNVNVLSMLFSLSYRLVKHLAHLLMRIVAVEEAKAQVKKTFAASIMVGC